MTAAQVLFSSIASLVIYTRIVFLWLLCTKVVFAWLLCTKLCLQDYSSVAVLINLCLQDYSSVAVLTNLCLHGCFLPQLYLVNSFFSYLQCFPGMTTIWLLFTKVVFP